MTVAKFVQPNYTTQSAAVYKAALDAAIAVLATVGGDYACHAKDTPDMQVLVDAGQLFLANSTLVSNAQQTSAAIVAPVTNPRIDRIVINDQTGVVSVIAGTEAASPTAPAITAGTRPVAQILLQTSSTVITNSMITDERVVETYAFSTFIRTLLDDADAATARETLGAAGIGSGYAQNVGLTAAVATKALTVALKTKALADPSAGSPVEISFRNATATVGDYVVRNTTAAVSVVIPSGASLGFTAAEAGSIYTYAIDNAGAIELAVSKKAIFDESRTHNTTAIGTGSDSDNVLYSTTARTGVPVRLVGRIDITTGAVTGEWDNEDTRTTVWTPAMNKTGEVVQVVSYQTGAVQTNTPLAAIPDDDTIPQNTEGDQFMTVSITPKRSENYLHIDVLASLSCSTEAYTVSALFQDSTANALAATTSIVPTGNCTTVHITHYMKAGTISPTTFKYRAGPNSSSYNLTFNGAAGARKLGGVIVSSMTVTEISG